MADVLRRLDELNARLGLVPKGSTVEELERNASAFTHEAAKLLHGEGWRRIRRPTAPSVEGLEIGTLVHMRTFEVRLVVFAAGATDAQVAWHHVGQMPDVRRFVEVRPDAPATNSIVTRSCN